MFISLLAAIGLESATANRIAVPMPPEPPPIVYDESKIKIPEKSEWLKIEFIQTSPDTLRDKYQKLLEKKLISTIPAEKTGIERTSETESGSSTQAKAIAIKTSKQGFISSYNFFIDDNDELWRFEGSEASGAVHQSIHLSFANGERYIVKLRTECLNIDDTCKKNVDDIARPMMAPRPPKTAKASVIYDWIHIRTQQDCIEPGPLNMKSPNYPTVVKKENISDTVKIRYTADACGYPMLISIEESSKSPELDKAAVQAAWKWRIKLSDKSLKIATGKLRQFVIPIRFTVPLN